MAQVSIIAKALLLVLVVAIFSTVSAQDSGMAPAPSPDAGAAFSLPTSGAVVGTSIVFSLIALLRN
ncbi:hypothetical protein LguiA_024614 [Lonicera macranthoides]